jgi:hypothetical protein
LIFKRKKLERRCKKELLEVKRRGIEMQVINKRG